MSQPGFFDLSRRYDLDAKPDPLLALNRLIPGRRSGPNCALALEETGQRMTPKRVRARLAASSGTRSLCSRTTCFSRSTTSRTTMWNI